MRKFCMEESIKIPASTFRILWSNFADAGIYFYRIGYFGVFRTDFAQGTTTLVRAGLAAD